MVCVLLLLHQAHRPERMLCALGRDILIRDQVDEGEDDDPDDVDEVPVESGYFDIERLILLHPATQRNDEERHEPDDAERHMEPVESGERIERHREHVRRVAESLMIELMELEPLAAQE